MHFVDWESVGQRVTGGARFRGVEARDGVREFQERVSAMQSQFSADVGAVILHGARADEELGSNFLVGFMLSDKGQDRGFVWSERAAAPGWVAWECG